MHNGCSPEHVRHVTSKLQVFRGMEQVEELTALFEQTYWEARLDCKHGQCYCPISPQMPKMSATSFDSERYRFVVLSVL